DMDPIAVTPGSVTDPANGTAVLNADGTVTYIPDAGFTGEDTFTYEICDNGSPALCDSATVTVTVNPANDINETVANDDAYNTTSDSPINANVLDNDTDPENDTQIVNVIPVVGTNNGTLMLNTDGTFVYTPNPGFVGTDSFVYSVCDDGTPQACDEATVYITVGMELIPDFGPTIFTGNTTVIGGTGVVDFRVFVAEYANQNSNGVTPVELRIIKNDDFVITYNPTLTTINGVPVSNEDWLYDDSNPSLHRFTYIGNGGIFNASTASNIGINAIYNPPMGTNGTFPIKVTVKYFSGGEINNNNNDDLDYIEYNNN
ncbi:Ig-like domain-containing protein, partial [Patiriisocius marinistellae]|uniref:Ig-like domain-containing protein n=1 Tax=Patiriisocius marinistellae TaxID=2494560 RepID=UPI00125CF1A2